MASFYVFVLDKIMLHIHFSHCMSKKRILERTWLFSSPSRSSLSITIYAIPMVIIILIFCVLHEVQGFCSCCNTQLKFTQTQIVRKQHHTNTHEKKIQTQFRSQCELQAFSPLLSMHLPLQCTLNNPQLISNSWNKCSRIKTLNRIHKSLNLDMTQGSSIISDENSDDSNEIVPSNATSASALDGTSTSAVGNKFDHDNDANTLDIEVLPMNTSGKRMPKAKPLSMSRKAAMERAKSLPLKDLILSLDRRGILYSVRFDYLYFNLFH